MTATPCACCPAPAGASGLGAALARHLTPADLAAGVPVSVWVTGQQVARTQRARRYLPESVRHPGKMLPAIARHAITAYTQPGEVVFDPMCGIGTTLIEAVHLGRDAVGTEYEPQWAHLTSANLRHAAAHDAPGTGRVWHADARHLPDELLQQYAGKVALLLTSPPYGPSNHGQVTTHGRLGHQGAVVKSDHRYSRDRANLAHRPTAELLGGFEAILRAALPLLAPGATVAVTARPWRRHGELVDLPTAVLEAGRAAGLTPIERCVALLARVEHGDPDGGEWLIAHGSFFQMTNIRDARAAGIPQSLIVHEDVLLLAAPGKRPCSAQLKNPQPHRTAPPCPSTTTPRVPGAGHGRAA
jgi:modification methylase